MGFFALRAGAKSSPRSLVGILREAHQASSEAVKRDLAQRAESGAPDDDAPKVPEWVDRPELDGITIRVKAVAHADYLGCVLRVADAARGLDGSNLKAMLSASTDLATAMGDFVALAVAEVCGLEDESGAYALGGESLSDDDVKTLGSCGLLGDVYAAAKFMQELTPSEKKTCGLLQQQT